MSRFSVSSSPALAIIGGGRMGEAILAGILDANIMDRDALVVTQPDAARRAYLTEKYEVRCVEDNSEIGPVDIVLLAVKPQIIDGVVSAMNEGGAFGPDTLVISIAVGVPAKRLEKLMDEDTPVVRVMPNTPALIRSGVSVLSPGTCALEEDVADAQVIFDAVGETVILDERFQDSCAALSGSGPAYFEAIVDALSRAGVKHGIPRDIAQKLVVATMRGTADLITETGEHPQALIDQVTSPGGTTIAALEAMEAKGLRSALGAGVNAAIDRARELSKD